MLKRTLAHELVDQFQNKPVVWLSGARQAGKTTLVRACFPELTYYSFEDLSVRLAAETHPEDFLASGAAGMILDEMQRTPTFMRVLLAALSANTWTRKLVLISSINPLFILGKDKNLLAKIAFLTLWPCAYEECPPNSFSLDHLLCQGLGPFAPTLALDLSLEREVATMLSLKAKTLLPKLLFLLAERLGQVVNYSELARLLGVSSPTIKQWIEVLKALYIVVEIAPFTHNARKRVVKSPKFYFSEVPLAAALLSYTSPEQVAQSPLRARLYENLMVMEIIKRYHHQGLQPFYGFFRDVQGYEVPLLLQQKNGLLPVAIALTATFDEALLTGIRKFRRATNHALMDAVLLYNGQTCLTHHNTRIFNLLNSVN